MNYLFHHGVKGMHWGIRRYQNKDGTLTSAGRMRLKGANRKHDLIKSQLGIDVDRKKLLKSDKDASKEVNLKKRTECLSCNPANF